MTGFAEALVCLTNVGSSQLRANHSVLVFDRDQGGVVAAEAEGIVERDTHFLFPRDIRRVIQVALRVGILEIDRRRNLPIAHRQRAGRHLDRAGPA